MNSEHIEVDLIGIIKDIWRKKWIISLISLMVSIFTYVGIKMFVTPKYISDTRIYVVSKKNEERLTTQDLQLGSYLINDYKEIILSRDVLKKIIEKENLNMYVSDLREKINVASPNGTRVISISVTDENPNKAKMIADSIREIASEKIKEVTKIEDITVLEKANLPVYSSIPNTKKYAILAFFLTMVTLIGFIELKEILDDKVVYPEDIEEKLKLSLLGIIPNKRK